MSKYLKKIKSLKKISKSTATGGKFLIAKKDNIKIYYAPFDYINSKAKIMIVGITPGLQQMLQSFQVINDGKSLKKVKDLSSFKGSMRTTLIKYLDELKINNFNIKMCNLMSAHYELNKIQKEGSRIKVSEYVVNVFLYENGI